MNINEILSKIEKEIVPSKNISPKITNKIEKINSLIKNSKLKAKAVLGGSFAKGTYLKNDFDIDIFIKFDLSYKDKDLSNLLEPIIKLLKPQRLHGSRDYFKLPGTPSFEIIPVLDVNKPEDATNITDMSPLHAKWVNENIKPKQRNEIRLAKAFCKANKVYGAESYIQGISGHVLDILVIHYGSFLKLLEEITKLKDKEIIDHYNIHKGNIKKLNKSKIQSPIIVIDPITPDRNAAAALGKEKFEILKKKARAFLENPDISFFRKEIITEESLIKKQGKNKLIIYYLTPQKGKKDVIGSKILKAYKYILNKFTNNSFTIIQSGWEWDDKAMLWYICKNEMLEKEFLRVGPPINQQYHVELFKNKHKEIIIKDERIYAKVKRKYRKIEKLAEDLLSNETVNEKINEIEFIFLK